MSIPKKTLSGALGTARTATLWCEPNLSELDLATLVLDAGGCVLPSMETSADGGSMRLGRPTNPASLDAAATLLRRTVLLPPPPLRPYFTVCAVESWRRVPVQQLADWSGFPLNSLKRRLAVTALTPAGVAAWSLALHAAWLLDVAALPAVAVMHCMGLRRSAALGAVLGARGVRYSGGSVESGAFAAALDRYLAVLRAAFRA